MNNKIVLAIAAVVIAEVAFGGGYLVATKVGDSSSSNAAGRTGPGGAFAQLTEAEREQLQTMTAEERTQFFRDKGIELPQGFDGANAPGGATGAPGGIRGGTRLLEGTVNSVAADKITLTLASGGSATVYVDADTVKAAVSGANPEIVKDAKVYVLAETEAEGVTAARIVVVK